MTKKRLSVIALLLAVVFAVGVLMCGCGDSSDSDSKSSTDSTASTVSAAAASKADLIKDTWYLVGHSEVKGTFDGSEATIEYNGETVSGSYSVDSADNLVFDDITYSYSEIPSGTDLSSGESPFSGDKWYVSDSYLVIGDSVYEK